MAAGSSPVSGDETRTTVTTVPTLNNINMGKQMMTEFGKMMPSFFGVATESFFIVPLCTYIMLRRRPEPRSRIRWPFIGKAGRYLFFRPKSVTSFFS